MCVHALRIHSRRKDHGCRCSGTFIAWDHRMVTQLGDGVRVHFPVTLTCHYARDTSIISLLRAWTLGNSASALCNNLLEDHSEEWLTQKLGYLSDCATAKGSQIECAGVWNPSSCCFNPCTWGVIWDAVLACSAGRATLSSHRRS